MSGKKREFSSEFKRNAVRLVLSGRKTRAQVARELGVRADLLFRWQKALAPRSVAGSESDNVSTAERRIRELERELATVTEEREILKKAVAFFAKE